MGAYVPPAPHLVVKAGVRITQVIWNLIRRVHCVSPPSRLCLQLVSVHNFTSLEVQEKFAYRTRNHCGSIEYCEKNNEWSEKAVSGPDTPFEGSITNYVTRGAHAAALSRPQQYYRAPSFA